MEQTRDGDGGEGCNDQDQIGFGCFDVVVLEHSFHVADDERGEVVETFTDALEHDQAEWDAYQRVGHRE